MAKAHAISAIRPVGVSVPKRTPTSKYKISTAGERKASLASRAKRNQADRDSWLVQSSHNSAAAWTFGSFQADTLPRAQALTKPPKAHEGSKPAPQV